MTDKATRKATRDDLQDDADIFDALMDEPEDSGNQPDDGDDSENLGDDDSENLGEDLSDDDQGGEQGQQQTADSSDDQSDESEESGHPAWYQDLDEDARREVDELMQARAERESLRQQYNALHGRLAPVQQQNNQLMQRLQQLQSGQGKSQQATPPTPKDLSGSEEFQKYKQDFPEEAAAIEREFERRDGYIRKIEERLQKVDEGFQLFNQERLMAQTQQAYHELSQAHPDYQECLESQEYQDFLRYQPPGFQQIAMTTTDPREAAWVLDQFKGYLGQQIEMYESSQQQSGGNAAKSIRARRQRQLEASPNAGATGLGVQGGDSFDDDADIFESLLEE